MWRRAREVGEREDRSYTDATAGLLVPNVTTKRASRFQADHSRSMW